VLARGGHDAKCDDANCDVNSNDLDCLNCSFTFVFVHNAHKSCENCDDYYKSICRVW